MLSVFGPALLVVLLAFGGLLGMIFVAGLVAGRREVRAERRAGLPRTYPERDAAAARRAAGGYAATARGIVKGLRS